MLSGPCSLREKGRQGKQPSAFPWRRWPIPSSTPAPTRRPFPVGCLAHHGSLSPRWCLRVSGNHPGVWGFHGAYTIAHNYSNLSKFREFFFRTCEVSTSSSQALTVGVIQFRIPSLFTGICLLLNFRLLGCFETSAF